MREGVSEAASECGDLPYDTREKRKTVFVCSFLGVSQRESHSFCLGDGFR